MALGAEPMNEVFSAAEVDLKLPVLITAQLLVAFHPKGVTVWDYLDTIWNAFDIAGRAFGSLLPAMTLLQKYAQIEAKQIAAKQASAAGQADAGADSPEVSQAG
jgi:hypothetical protein